MQEPAGLHFLHVLHCEGNNMAKVRARTSALVGVDGSPFGVKEGESYDEDSPVVQQHPDLFERAVPVEEATANPGQRRATRRTS